MSELMVFEGEQINGVRMLTLIHALRFEIKSGLKATRYALTTIAREQYGCKSRTKAGCLAELEAMFEEWKRKEYGHD